MKKQIKKPFKTALFVLSFLGMTCFIQSMTPANQVNAAELTGYCTADELNIRKEASTDSEALVQIHAGDSVELVGSSDDWYKIQTGDTTGYVKKIYISTENVSSSTTKGLNVRAEAKEISNWRTGNCSFQIR